MLVFLTQASYGPKIGESLATMLIHDFGMVNGKLLMLAYSLPLKAIVQGFTDEDILAYQEDIMRLYYYVRYVRENLQSSESPAQRYRLLTLLKSTLQSLISSDE
jgi:hypothetical protein